MAVRALKPELLVRAALRRLRGRDDVRLVEDVARSEEIAVRIVGGAVRDAFLGRKGGDLDLVVSHPAAARFAELLAKRLGSRVVAVGAAPRRVLKIPRGGHEIDVWEAEEPPEKDLLRRDLTVNTLAFDLLGGTFAAAKGALQDLGRKRLAAPRPGVLLEDPLRVLRVARFLAELPGFRISKRLLPELRQAAPFLRKVAPERVLAEMDRLLSTPPGLAARSLEALERWGALAALLPGTTARERRRGISLVRKLERPSPPVARALLLSPLGETKALFLLRRWRVQRRELQMLAVLLTLSRGTTGHRGRRRFPPDAPTRREVVEFLRNVSPFFKEAVLFLGTAGGAGARRFVGEIGRVLSRPASLSRILRPSRPVDAMEVSRLLGLPEGPALGAALRELDVALAAGEVRGKRAAVRFLVGLPASGATPSR
jgi:poly(A) polymerase